MAPQHIVFDSGIPVKKTKILKHLGLWDIKTRPPPRGKKASRLIETVMDYSESQLPPSYDYFYCDEIYLLEDLDFSGEAISS